MYELKPMDDKYALMNDGKVEMLLDQTTMATLAQYSQRLGNMGVNADDQTRIGGMVEANNGTINLGNLVKAYRALDGTQAICEAQGMEYNPTAVIDEMVADATPRPRSMWKRGAVAAGLVLALGAGMASATSVTNPGGISDSNIQVVWDYKTTDSDLNGQAILDIYNIGSETRSNFEFEVADFLTLTDSTGWGHSYDSNTDIVSVFANPDTLSIGDSLTIPFTFDPLGKELKYGNLDYWNNETSGTLENVGTVTNSVPEPNTLIAFLIGLGAVIKRRNKK